MRAFRCVRGGPEGPAAVPLPRLFDTEPVIAWREWTIVERPAGGFRLTPLVVPGMVWPVGRPTEAKCLADCSAVAAHDAPDEWGNCGIYGLKAPPDNDRPSYYMGSVIGTVALWGRVVEHELGYRAEFAYPQRLRVICERCRSESPPKILICPPPPKQGVEVRCRDHAEPRTSDRKAVDPLEAQAQLLDVYAVDLLPIDV